jgi:hypothetical protein
VLATHLKNLFGELIDYFQSPAQRIICSSKPNCRKEEVAETEA